MAKEKKPELFELIPDPENIDIDNLGKEGVVTSDTFNTAKKLLRDLKSLITGTVFEQHSFNHLRCIWINGVLKPINAYWKYVLEDSLESIPRIYRVTVDLSGIILAYHKEFSLLCNYPKGHGEQFCEWMKKNHPGYYLFCSERVNGFSKT